MLLHEPLLENARRHPERIALICGAERLRYCDLDEASLRLAAALEAQGFRRGDRGAVFLENSVESVVSLFAVLRCGGAFVLLNPSTRAGKLASLLAHSGASALVCDAARAGRVESACAGAPGLRTVVLAGAEPARPRAGSARWSSYAEAMGGPRPAAPRPGLVDQDLAGLLYTSGSTGNPKGVMLTHLNVVSAIDSITAYLENSAQDVTLNVLPLSFGYGLCQLLAAIRTGGSLVLEKSFAYPYPVAETMARERVTGFAGVPTLFALLLRLEGLKALDFGALRYLTNAGAALPPALQRGLREAFPRARLFCMYGQTECLRISYLPPEELDRRAGSVGRGMPNMEVYLVDEEGRRLPPGSSGELVARGANVMRGYWDAPEETARALRPGPLAGERVLHTGDLFRSDEEGYLYFVARKDDIIKSRGEKVSPREIEHALHELEGVVEAAVIGVPDELLGQAVKAFVVTGEGSALTEKDVLRHCARLLEDHLVPRQVVFRSELPKTESGKIRKSELR